MAIQIAFDSSHNVIPPTLVLTTRSGDRLGGLLYHNLVVKQAIRQSMEMSFSVNKADYCEKNHNADLWNLIADFKLVWCKEWNCYFEINVTTNEEYTTDKEITAVSLGDAELSQINLYNIQINTEDDIAREDYEPAVLYNENNPNASFLHRIMEKVPHYTVKYVDPAVASIQRTFTFDNKSLYDAFQEIAEEMECVFDIACRDGTNGIERTISVFDLENYGNDTNILLSTDALADNVSYSIDTGAVKNCFRLEGGDDLMTATIRNCNPNGSSYIWYISNEMKSDMSDELVEQLEKYNEQYDYFYKHYNPFDTEIKNYTGKMLVSRLLQDYGYGGNVDLLHRPLVPMSNIVNAGWDDEIYDEEDGTENTATVYTSTFSNEDGTIAANFTPIVVNSNGGYVRTLSPQELQTYAGSVIEDGYNDSENLKIQIGSFFYGSNAIERAEEASVRIHELQEYYYLDDSGDEFINPEIVTEFNSSIADKTDIINNYNTLVRKYQTYTDDYKEIKTPINGYPAIMEAYYNTIDFYYYLNDNLMPTVEMSNTNAQTEANKLHYQSLKNTAIQNLSSTTSVATVNSAIAAMAKAIVDTRYQIKVLDDECSFNYSATEGRPSFWNGKIKVTNYSNEEDTYTAELRSIPISSDYATFVEQKLKTVLANTREDTIADIEDLFKLEDNSQRANTPFKVELKKYSLQRLKAFHDACQSCIDILIQQGIADNNNTESEIYTTIYLPYYNKLGSIQSEMDLRQSELEIVAGSFDSEGGLLADGMQTVLEKERNAIQDNLNFQDYLGSTLWQEFVAYRREDTYSNTNYVSDGLGNDELFARAMELIQTAKDEIEKSATKQHTINARLKNLLVMKEFSSIVDCFEVGNWLRLKVDGKIFKLRLVDYQIDFEDLGSIDITFSDIVVDGTEATAKDILNQAASMATSYNTVSRQARKGDNSSALLNDWVSDGLSLTTTKIIDTADNQEVSWDKHGLICREYNNLTGSYNDTQVKLINKGLYVTDNGWRTAKAGIGNFTFFNPAANDGEGEYQEAYGVIADTIVGNIILSKSVGIYNTKNSITMDEDGFVLTTDGTGSDEPQSVFTIRRKTVNNGVKSFRDMFYIDSNGYVTINGGVKIDIDGESSNSTMVEMVDGKITTHITEELENGGLIESSISQTAREIRTEVSDTAEGLSSTISQTANEIKNTVAEAVSKYDETGYTISIRDYGIPNASVYPPSQHRNQLYLDQETGAIYKSNGSAWNRLKDSNNNDVTLPLITTNLASTITQTAREIRAEVSDTANGLQSSISQTASEIKSTVSKAVSKYDTTGYTITLYGYGTPDENGYAASDYNGKYYLDQNNGKLYLSNDNTWAVKTTLNLITSNLSSQITQTASEIRSDVSATYETKSDANAKKTNLESSISQTAGQIKSTVSKAVSKYDTSGYTITLYGYDTPSSNNYTASDYNNKYYLDQNNGKLYLSDGSSWSNVKTLTLITDKLSSQITQTDSEIRSDVSATYETKTDANTKKTNLESTISQTATQIKSTVSSAVSKYDTSGYTIGLYGYGTPASNSYSASSYNGKYYLDQNNGKLYLSNGSSWSNVKTLSLITDNLSTQITQTDSQIRSDVSSAYETKADANTKKTNLESSISQTAAQIRSTVSSAVSKYDTTGYTITISGYGAPTTSPNSFAASSYNGKYYLDQNNGKLYLSNGSSWSNPTTLTLITSNLQTQITQNATDITSKVSSGDVHTIIQQTPEDVRIAWNGISNYISFENAAIKIKNSSNNLLMQLSSSGLNLYNSSSVLLMNLNNNGMNLYNSSNALLMRLNNNGMNLYDTSNVLLMRLNSDGLGLYESDGNSGNRQTMRLDRSGTHYYHGGNYLGKIGTNTMGTDTSNNSIKGLVFDLDTNAQYMAWAARTNSSDSYVVRFAYFQNNITTSSGISFKKGFRFDDNVYFGSNGYIGDSGIAIVLENTNNGAIRLTGKGGASITLSDNISISSNSGHISSMVDLYMNDYVIYDSTISFTSDARLKKDIADSNVRALAILNKIDVKQFNWIETDNHVDAGFIAQQLREIIPDAVLENPESTRLSIRTDILIPYIVKAIQELTKCINTDNRYENELKSMEIIDSKDKWKDEMKLDDKKRFIKSTRQALTDNTQSEKGNKSRKRIEL